MSSERLGNGMTGEIIAIVTVGVALAGLILTSVHGLRGEIAALRTDTQEQIAGLRADTQEQIAGLRADTQEQIGGLREEIAALRGEIAEIRSELAQLRERMAHLEGLLDGLREAIAARVAS